MKFSTFLHFTILACTTVAAPLKKRFPPLVGCESAIIKILSTVDFQYVVHLIPFNADTDAELSKRHPIGPLCGFALLRSTQQLFTTYSQLF
jgi:hypothetical protein